MHVILMSGLPGGGGGGGGFHTRSINLLHSLQLLRITSSYCTWDKIFVTPFPPSRSGPDLWAPSYPFGHPLSLWL